MLADRAADKLLATPDRLFERIAPSQPGGDGRGIGAAGPVGGNAGDKRAGELRHSLAVEAMRLGAFDFIEKPFDAAALERSGRLIRRPDGTWLVRDHDTAPRTAPESVAQRRRLLAA